MEGEYRKFLALHVAYPHAEIVPCKVVDDMWHQHILDTAGYRDDCDAIFGRFLDHFPYFGIRGDEDAQALHDAHADTARALPGAGGPVPPRSNAVVCWAQQDVVCGAARASVLMVGTAAYSSPGLPRDPQDHQGDRETDERVGDIESQRDGAC